MSVAQRLSENFAGEDWLVLYQTFTQINLNSYDFQTIKNTMVDYIRRNYPENFNDWINSSEFVALIDLLSYMGGMLAFRMDLNSRENFMDTASKRESILRLSRFLSYNPNRAFPASGLLKITSIQCTQDLIDSSGVNINNTTIIWDDSNNPNWYEQWVLVLNSILVSTNPWGTPLYVDTVAGIPTQLYRLNNIIISVGNYPFSTSSNGVGLSCEVVNMTFDSIYGFTERTPDPMMPFHICYQNDGNGNSSPNTGFFVLFKQGSLSKVDYVIQYPIENLTINLPDPLTNQTDIWVQSINDRGEVLANGQWTRVGFVPIDDVRRVFLTGENISYNSVPLNVSNIFQVLTLDNDVPMLRFGDGQLGQIPTGNLRVWYRTSLNQNVFIKSDNITNIPIQMPYIGSDGNKYNSSLGLSLQTNISNGVAAETNDQIRKRAAQVYGTQGRMVNGNDYNLIPQTMNAALKVKAINRVYSGQSRYIDINDPTGNYSNLSIIGDDAALYWETNDLYNEIPLSLNMTVIQIITTIIQPNLNSTGLRDFLYDSWVRGSLGYNEILDIYNFNSSEPYLWWEPSTSGIYTSSGIFVRSNQNPNIFSNWSQYTGASIGPYGLSNTYEQYIIEGSLIKFAQAGWVTVIQVINDGSSFTPTGQGWVTLSKVVSLGDQILKVLPAFRQTLNDSEIVKIQNSLNSQRTFGVGFDYANQVWYVIDATKINLTNSYTFLSKGTVNDSSWLLECEYNGTTWALTTRGLRYVLECEASNTFYFVNSTKIVDKTTGLVQQDNISILRSNINPVLSISTQWKANTYYSPNQIIYQPITIGNPPTIQNSYYSCITAHTSGTSFDTGYYSTTATRWISLWRNLNMDLGEDYIWKIISEYYNLSGLQEPAKVQITFNDTNGVYR